MCNTQLCVSTNKPTTHLLLEQIEQRKLNVRINNIIGVRLVVSGHSCWLDCTPVESLYLSVDLETRNRSVRGWVARERADHIPLHLRFPRAAHITFLQRYRGGDALIHLAKRSDKSLIYNNIVLIYVVQ